MAHELRDHRVDHGAELDTATERAAHRRHAAVGDAARHDVAEHPEVRIDVEREPVTRPAASNLDADRRDLLVTDPDARITGVAVSLDPEVA